MRADWFATLSRIVISVAVVLLVGAALAAAFPGPGHAVYEPDSPASLVPGAKPTPGAGMSIIDPRERLARPPMSDPPTQVELGHAEYWMSCMVCHGDRGQGLTVEWRSILDPADQNCWQSKCHAANHPPEGFQIPREAPLVMGTGALGGYRTATDLYEYLRVKMPWSFPGLFEDEKYWELTAYLANANNIELPHEPIGPDNGDEVLLVPGLVQAPHEGLCKERAVAGAVVVLLLGTLILQRWTRPLETRRRADRAGDGEH
jgi:hypothetical protein